MLMALRFEPSRFFLKGKVTQKQTSYKHKHQGFPFTFFLTRQADYPCRFLGSPPDFQLAQMFNTNFSIN